MNWGKVTFVFFALMSLTTTAGYIYFQSSTALFIAASINIVSTLLKIGVKNMLAAELFASSLVADLHLIPAFYFAKITVQSTEHTTIAISLAIGAVIANIFSMALVLIEASKTKEEF